jgi:hypothetical protein
MGLFSMANILTVGMNGRMTYIEADAWLHDIPG